MLNNPDMGRLESEKLKHLPNVNSLLKISLGLILFTIISTALVYAETMSVDVEGNSFDIDYTANQVVINSIITEYEPSSDYAGLIINVNSPNGGTLDFVFDRTFFDSTFDGVDDPFFVVADGIEVPFTETVTTQSRTLSIEVPAGTEDLEIIGTVFGDSQSTSDAEEAAKAAADAAAAKAAADAAATEDTQKTQCGPGTILKDGACVLDERCGPGTILKDGACVLDEIQKSSGTSVKGIGKELIVGVAAAFVIAGIIGIVLGLMSKASKSRD